MDTTLRISTPDDYPTLAKLWNASYPDLSRDAATMELDDSQREAGRFFVRLVLERGGEPVGFGAIGERRSAEDGAFALQIAMPDALRSGGADDRLYDALLGRLPRSPRRLFTWAREDFGASLAFWRAQGFEIAMRSYESVVDLRALDPAELASTEARGHARAPGLELLSFAEWRERDGEDAMKRAFYDLHGRLDADVPDPGTHEPPPFESFVERHFEDPRRFDDGFIFAFDRHTDPHVPIGVTELWTHHEPGRLETGLTGVLAPYRRRGVASAIKARSLRAARAADYERIHTWNAEANAGMLAINRRLGFEPRPVMFDLVKEMAATSG